MHASLPNPTATREASRWLGCGILAAVLAVGVHADPRVDSFSPSGYSKDVRQVSVRFSADMVALGDPDLPDPFRIRCPTPGAGRWLDERTWVYDFGHAVPGAVQCRFRLRRGARTLDGTRISGERTFAFNTGGPNVRARMPAHGRVDERQVFLLGLDAVARPDSIRAHARCRHGDGRHEVGVQVVEGEARREIIDALTEHMPYRLDELIDAVGEYLPPRGDDESRRRAAFRRIVLIRCQGALTPASPGALVWGAGVASADGQQSPEDQVIEFHVRSAFDASPRCLRGDDGCLPHGLGVTLSSEMPRAFAERFRLHGPSGPPRQGMALERDDEPYIGSVRFPGPFREDTAYRIELTEPVHDIDGRPLANADEFPLSLQTRRLPSGATFFGDLTAVQAAAAYGIPLLLRRPARAEDCGHATGNCRISGRAFRTDDDAQILSFVRGVVARSRPTVRYDVYGKPHSHSRNAWNWPSSQDSVLAELPAAAFELPVDPAAPYQLLGVPAQRGFHAVEVSLPRPAPVGGLDHVAAGALVTNMAVHFIRARESSVVWVTALDDAQPVANAAAAIADACTGERFWEGITDADGIARVPIPLPETGDCHPFYGDYLVTARTDDDFSFAITGWNRDRWRLTDRRPELFRPETLLHVVFDRSLYMPGQRVGMKLVLRTPVTTGLAIPDGLPASGKLVLTHEDSGQSFTEEVRIDADGSALAHFDLPATATLGWYSAELRLHDQDWSGGTFRVEQFRAGAMRAELGFPEETMVAADAAPLSIAVAYLGGGVAANLPVTLRTEYAPEDSPLEGEPPTVRTDAELTLDADGRAMYIAELPPIGLGAWLTVEMDYFDASGEQTTARAWLELLPAALRVYTEDAGRGPSGESRIRIEVTDLDGSPVADREVDASLYSMPEGYSAEVRLAGGFRAWSRKPLGEPAFVGKCSANTDREGVAICKLPAEARSRYVLVASRIADADGRVGDYSDQIYIAPEDPLPQQADETLSLRVAYPGDESEPFRPGESAVIEASSPFKDPTGLVAVLREGVLDAFVTHIDGPTSRISVPLRDHYAPNVEVSVLAVRGRSGPAPPVDAPAFVGDAGQPIKRADAAAPATARSTVTVPVDVGHHELDVTVDTDQEVYGVRDNVEVRIAVAKADGEVAAGSDLAIAVLDEALLDRLPNLSWDILRGMMRWRTADAETASSFHALGGVIDYPPPPDRLDGEVVFDNTYQSGEEVEEMVVTGSHLARDDVDVPALLDAALPAGRERGAPDEPPTQARARQNFDRLVLWEGRLRADAQGRATLSFPLNDLLTSLRIAVVAMAGTDLFGTGETTIRTTQDLIVHAGLPPTVREGDRFSATFTVQNAARREQNVELGAALDGQQLAPRRVTLAAGASQEVAWQVTVPPGADALAWHVDATAESASDSLRVSQQVYPLVPVEVQQATLERLDAPVQLPVAPPARALPDKGGVRVALRHGLGAGLEAVRDYMAGYPYTCIEQQVSVAIALAHAEPERWSRTMATARTALDRSGLLRFFPSEQLAGSAWLTAYVLTIADAAGKEVPGDLRDAMLAGLDRHLSDYRDEDAEPPFRSEWEWSLPALVALARYGALDPARLPDADRSLALAPSSVLLDWIDVLTRVAPEHSDIAASKRVLFARLNLQGTTLGLSTEIRDRAWWQSTDANAARLLLLALDEPEWQGELPRLMRGLLGRQQRGRWDTTMANAWGSVAVLRFRAAFESEPVSGSSTVRTGAVAEHVAWPPDDEPAPLLIPWSAAETLALDHQGSGAPWSLIAFDAAVPLRRPVNRGYRIERKVTAVSRKGRAWQRGDVVEIDISVRADRDMAWVVVEDPIPPGATILGGGLGGDSAMLAEDAYRPGDGWPAFVERMHSGYRAYYEHVPKGTLNIRYRVRYNTAGRFNLPPTRVEAMYAPEMHAMRPNKRLAVE